MLHTSDCVINSREEIRLSLFGKCADVECAINFTFSYCILFTLQLNERKKKTNRSSKQVFFLDFIYQFNWNNCCCYLFMFTLHTLCLLLVFFTVSMLVVHPLLYIDYDKKKIVIRLLCLDISIFLFFN